MNSFRASVIDAEECHCRGSLSYEKPLYTYVTSNESLHGEWNVERNPSSHLSHDFFRFFASALTNVPCRFFSSRPRESIRYFSPSRHRFFGRSRRRRRREEKKEKGRKRVGIVISRHVTRSTVKQLFGRLVVQTRAIHLPQFSGRGVYIYIYIYIWRFLSRRFGDTFFGSGCPAVA